MALLLPLMKTRLWRIFLTYFMLSCLLPLLVIICVVYQYVSPVLSAAQVQELTNAFTLGLSAIFMVQLLSFFIMSGWIRKVENLAVEVQTRTHTNAKEDDPLDENEIVAIHRAFQGLLEDLDGVEPPPHGQDRAAQSPGA